MTIIAWRSGSDIRADSVVTTLGENDLGSLRWRSAPIELAVLGAIVVLLLAGFRADPAYALSGGCQKTGSSGLFTLTTVDGKARSRTYLVQVPTGYTPTRTYPVAFVFHGYGGDAKQAYSWGLQRAAGAADAALFVFPQGMLQKEGIGWDDAADGADLPFFDNMLKDLCAMYCIDERKVFVAGFSWGGDFVVALACRRGDVIRAAQANSTDDEFKDANNYSTYLDLPCEAHKRPAIRFEHAAQGDASYPPPYFATTSRLFRHLNHCGPAKTRVPSTNVAPACVSYAACSSGYTECVFDRRLGHVLPPDWAQNAWQFFESFK